MKIGHILVIVVVVIALVVVGVFVVNKTNNNDVPNVPQNEVLDVNNDKETSKDALNITDGQGLTDFVTKVYEGLELFPTLSSMELDLTDADMVAYETGLTSVENVDSIVVSQPMMSSQAYSMILVKVKDGASADAIAKEMSENVNPNKWICVSAEKIYATSSGNVAFLVMTNTEMADDVFSSFKSNAGKCGAEYVVENALEEMPMEDDMAIPAA